MRKIELGYLNINETGRKYVNDVLSSNRLSAGKYIGQLERRLNTPSLTAMIEISGALDSDPNDFLTDVLKLMPRFKHLERPDPEAADF